MLVCARDFDVSAIMFHFRIFVGSRFTSFLSLDSHFFAAASFSYIHLSSLFPSSEKKEKRRSTSPNAFNTEEVREKHKVESKT